MRRSARLVLLIAALLTAAGLIVAFLGMVAMGFDFRKLDTNEYTVKIPLIEEDFTQIKVALDTADLNIVLADDGICRVECYERTDTPHSVKVVNGVLEIRCEDERSWYDCVGFQFYEPSVTVFLPEAAYERLEIEGDTSDISIAKELVFGEVEIEVDTGDVFIGARVERSLSITATTGDLTLEGVAVGGDLRLKTSTGEIDARSVVATAIFFETGSGEVEIAHASCATLTGGSDTGDVTLKSVLVLGHLRLVTDTGDVEIDHCDAATILIETDTGDVKGVLLSDMLFAVETDTGEVEIPRGTVGGLCEIRTETGDVEITVLK